MENNIVCTINSDDPAMFSSPLYLEYALLMEQGMSFEELAQLNINSIIYSFLNEKEKIKYINLFNSSWENKL